MRLTLNKIDFQISAVPGQLRQALLSEPMLASGIWRDIWKWDSAAAKGTFLTPVVDKGAIPLPNAMTFFIPRASATGVLTNNDKLAKKMGERFLEAVGVKSPLEVLRSMGQVLPAARIGMPHAAFAPLNPAASYVVKAHTEFAVVQLREAGRNLTAYLFLPSIITFHHEITAITDQAAYDALLAEKPEFATKQPTLLLPPGSKAGRDIRMLASAKRIEDSRPVVAQIKDSGVAADMATQRTLALIGREWDMLTKDMQPKAAQA